MSRSTPFAWAVGLLGFCFVLYFWGLGRTPFYTKGEPREAVEVWEEIHNGQWILPMRNGEDLPSKPPLFHWLAGGAAKLFGEVDEFSVRFPSAVLATLSVLLVFWLGVKKWGTSAGVFSAFILATNFEWMRAATAARVDMTTTAFLIAAFVALDRIVSAPEPTPRGFLAFYLAMALATLGKGPIGILLPSMVAVLYLALRRDLGRLGKMRVVSGMVIALTLAGSWYLLAIWKGGFPFVHKQIWVENFGRFFAAEETGAGHEHGAAYMVGGFLTGFAPWSFFTIPLLFFLYSERRRLEAEGFLYPIVWFTSVFVFYSISQSKRTVYLLPIYPAISLLLGGWWSRIAADPLDLPPVVARALRAVSVALALGLVAAIGVLLAAGLGADPLTTIGRFLHPKDEANLPLLENLLRVRFVSFSLFVAALVPMLGIFLLSLRQKRWALLFASLVAFVASGEAIVDEVFEPVLAEQRSFRPFMESVRGVVDPEDDLAFYRAFDYGAVFYARRHIRPLNDGFGEGSTGGKRSYVLLWESEYENLPDGDKARLQHLLTSNGTGPKGKDALVFALVKPAPATASAEPAAARQPPTP
jgi:4-amino-4-deoxy-L-arabinose transferase-like glycosyltransferase